VAIAVAVIAVEEDKLSSIKNSKHQIGMFGTFDVWNFGDLLFPLLAEKELSKRLGEVKIRPFSYYEKLKTNWPYVTTPLTELAETANTLDAVLIGGGHIIRFDKRIAPGYFPPNSSIHHPTGYWLTPALIALQQGLPIIWNAPGVFEENGFPEWTRPLLEFVFENSPYISVRDDESKKVISRYIDESKIKLVPDTAFGISRLVDQEKPSKEYEYLRLQLGLTKPYIILQATETITSIFHLIEANVRKFQDFQLLVVPISPVLGDQISAVQSKVANVIYLKETIHPLLIAELISHAEGVIGHSLHLSITALTFGVPVFRPDSINNGKYKILSTFNTVYSMSGESKNLEWFISKLGRATLAPEVTAKTELVAQHWKAIAKIILNGKINTQPQVNRFLQSLPGQLESKQISLYNSMYYNFCTRKMLSRLRGLFNILKRILGKE